VTISIYLKKCKLSELVTTEPEMEKWLSRTPVAGGMKSEGAVKSKGV
jgi:hypothetical protein